MQNPSDETIFFRYCRTFTGKLHAVDLARRHGRLVPRFDPALTDPEPDNTDPYSSAEYRELVEEVCYNLTPRQREILLTYADSPTVVETARRCGVSHPAIYDFLRRMARRNEYVAILWRRLKQEQA